MFALDSQRRSFEMDSWDDSVFSTHVLQPCEGDDEVGSRNLIEVRTRDGRGGPLPGLSPCV